MKDRLKIQFQREDDPLSIDYHLQSTDDQTNFLDAMIAISHHLLQAFLIVKGVRNNNKLVYVYNTVSITLLFHVVIWRFVYYDGIAGVFYTSSEGSFWHFNNLPSNEKVELLPVSFIQNCKKILKQKVNNYISHVYIYIAMKKLKKFFFSYQLNFNFSKHDLA